MTLNTAETAVAVIVPLLIVLILLLLLCWYYHKIYRRPYCSFLDNERGLTTTSVLIKRCDQSSTNEMEDRVLSRLRQDMSRAGLRLDEKSWDRGPDDGRTPVIVFCVISSRIGTDIENAMRGVSAERRVVLVILHVKLSSLLTGDLTDDEYLLDTTLKQRMTGIAHFAFSDHEGLYSCYQNDEGHNKLLECVKKLQ